MIFFAKIQKSIPYRAFSALTRLEKFGAFGIAFLFLCAGVVETAVISLVAPLVYALIDPKEFEKSTIGGLVGEWIGQPLDVVFPYVASLIALGVVCSSLLSMSALLASERHAALATTRMSRDTVEKVARAPYVWIIGKNSTILVRECYDNARIWRKGYLHALFGIFESSIYIALPAIAALALSKVGGLVALILTGIVAAAVVWTFRSKIERLAQRSKPAGDQLNKELNALFAGIREVKAGGATEKFVARYESQLASLNLLNAGLRFWSSAPVLVIAFFGQVGLLAASVAVWFSSNSGTDAVAQIALILVVASRLVPALGRLAAHVSAIQQHMPYVRDLLLLRDEAEAASEQQKRDWLASPKDWRAIRFENVKVTYPGKSNPSLAIGSAMFERGKRYGLVGRSGSGKSTFLAVVMKLIEPTSGRVIVDSVDLSSIRSEAWLSRTAYVPQTPYIFDGSIAQNVTFGDAVDERKLFGAIERARLTDVVTAMPEGHESKIGERGNAWSGGQAQRLAIARALYRDAEILILDEATSALDAITEAQVYGEFMREMPSRIVIHATHRVLTLREVDWIFVLDGGGIVAEGTFSSLMETSELFKSLAAEQPDPNSGCIEPKSAQ